MNKSFLKKIGAGIGAGIAFLPFVALALAPAVPGPIVVDANKIFEIVDRVLGWLGTIALSIAIIMFLYAAILYMFSGANAAAMSKAKDVLVYAIIGTVVAILAWSIPAFVLRFLVG